jgi:hypothetical protein
MWSPQSEQARVVSRATHGVCRRHSRATTQKIIPGMCHIILTLRHKSDSKAPIIAIDGAMMFCGILRIIRGESASAEDVFTYQLHVAK